MHDPLCRGIYQRYTDPKNCISCDLIWAVREDDKERYSINIGKLEAAFLQGREHTINVIVERLKEEMCETPSDDPCDICGGIELALCAINDEFGRNQ